MRGLITMNEEYETRFLCNSPKVRRRGPWAELGPRRPAGLAHHTGPGEPEEVGGGGAVGDLAAETGVPGFFASSGRIWPSKLKWLRLGVEINREIKSDVKGI